MQTDAGMDTGDIILQEEMPLPLDDTMVMLTERLVPLGAKLLVQALGLIESSEAVCRPQDESQATYTKRLRKEDGRIDWSRPARDIHNLVRAAVPWPVAHSSFEGTDVRIHKSEVVDETDASPPGVVVAVERDRIVVATGQALLSILVFQVHGKRAMPMADFLRGRAMRVAERFE